MNARRIIRLGILTAVTAVAFLSLAATALASWVYPLPPGETLISGAPKEQWDARISGDYVVWKDFRNTPAVPSNDDDNGDIYGLDLTTGIETRLTGAYTQGCADISGTKVVYTSLLEHEIPGDPDSEKYTYVYCMDVETGQRQRVSPSTYPDDRYPDGRDASPDEVAISGNRIVYTDGYATDNFDIWSELYTCDLTGGSFRRVMLFKGNIGSIRLSGDNLVYSKETADDGSDRDNYCYNFATATEKRISFTPGIAGYPAVSGNKVVWGGGTDASTYGVYLYDLSTPTGALRKLTSGPEIQSYSDIDGTKVAYMRIPTGAHKIYCVDLITGVDTPLVTGAGVWRYPPVISGNTVVFGDERSGNPDLYAFQMAVPNAPTRTALTITSDRATSTRGHAVVFKGTISPNVANNTHVAVWIRKSTSKVWTLLSTRHTFSSHHWSYTLSTKTRKHGTYYLQVRYAGSATLTAATSASKKLVIK